MRRAARRRMGCVEDAWGFDQGKGFCATCKVSPMIVQQVNGCLRRTCGSVRSSLSAPARLVTVGSEAAETTFPPPDGEKSRPRGRLQTESVNSVRGTGWMTRPTQVNCRSYRHIPRAKGADRWVSFVSSTRSCGAGPITTATSWRAGRLRTWRWRCSLACGAGQDADTPNARVPGSKTGTGCGWKAGASSRSAWTRRQENRRLGCGSLNQGGSRSGGTSRSVGKPTRSIPRGATTLKTGRSSSGSACTDLRLR